MLISLNPADLAGFLEIAVRCREISTRVLILQAFDSLSAEAYHLILVGIRFDLRTPGQGMRKVFPSAESGHCCATKSGAHEPSHQHRHGSSSAGVTVKVCNLQKLPTFEIESAQNRFVLQ
jgi:hypothetical protein